MGGSPILRRPLSGMHPDRDMHFCPFRPRQKLWRDTHHTQAHALGAAQFRADQFGRLRAKMTDDPLRLHRDQTQYPDTDAGENPDPAVLQLDRMGFIAQRQA